jgi:hypothetical protein
MNTSGLTYNFLDTDIEKEMNKLKDLSLLNITAKHSGKINAFKEFSLNELKDDFNFDEYDQIFLEPKKETANINSSRKKDKKYKVEMDEINKYFKSYERTIENEINKDLKESFKPMDFVPEEEKERANKLIDNSLFIKNAIEQEIVTYDEIVYFIDYYELLSLMEKKQSQAVNTLQKMSDLFEEDETWDNLQIQLEKTLSQTNLILDNKIDMRKLLYEYTEQSENTNNYNENNQNVRGSNDLSNDSYSKSNIINNNDESIIKKYNSKNFKGDATFTTTRVNKLITPRNELSESHSTIKSGIMSNRRPFPVKKISYDLYDNSKDNKMTNLIKVRNDRREVIRGTKGGKLNSRPDLFKFNFKDIKNNKAKGENLDNNNNNEEFKNKFIHLLQMPKKLLDSGIQYENMKEYTISGGKFDEKKNTIRRRIEDAVNFSKNKSHS